jgi:mRNA-degrading endonuclease RelE of RelBE toxin-antitoxin system
MKIKVITSENFRKKAKRLLKKYRSLKTELRDLEQQLLENPESGIPLGHGCYKIKVAVQSKGKVAV